MLSAQLNGLGQLDQCRDVLREEDERHGTADQQQDQQRADDSPGHRAPADQKVNADRHQQQRPESPEDVPRLPGQVAQIRQQQDNASANEHQGPEERGRAAPWPAGIFKRFSNFGHNTPPHHRCEIRPVQSECPYTIYLYVNIRRKLQPRLPLPGQYGKLWSTAHFDSLHPRRQVNDWQRPSGDAQRSFATLARRRGRSGKGPTGGATTSPGRLRSDGLRRAARRGPNRDH